MTFARVLGEELPLEFVYLAPHGHYDPGAGDFPGRGNYAQKVMTRDSVLNVLGPSAAAEFDRDRLLTVPAYELEELADGSVFIREAESYDDWNLAKRREIREHLGID